ncbi:MAG: four helix bundle protein [Candidatus Liptonbacteria bacterium]|nr:four helix bundle protein [Candidatus Liptonbacteria bacterium]
MISSYRELLIWQKGIELVREVYLLTDSFPKSELYGLTNQMRRAAISVPSNIAEGFTRGHSRQHHQDFIHFLRIAFASGAELETQLIIAKELKFGLSRKYEKVDSLLNETMKMLNKFIASLVLKSR